VPAPVRPLERDPLSSPRSANAENEQRPNVVVITGPTAAGKTGLAIALALRFDGEIVNADSVQVYRGMDIGSAKSSLEERAAVRHHLIDIVDPDEPYDAGRYMKDARRAIEEIHARGRIAFLVGGTGLYIRAALEGLVEGAAADLELREELEKEHVEAVREGDPGRLHRRLAELDPDAADKIHPNDLRRTIRALELNQRSGPTASRLRQEHGFRDCPYRVLHIALDPGVDVLVDRVDARCEQMIEEGLLQEVRQLRAQRYGPELRSMASIGYRHMGPVVDGAGTLAHALKEMQRDTRHFAKRQRTWLRKVPDAIWINPDDREEIALLVQRFLSGEEPRAMKARDAGEGAG